MKHLGATIFAGLVFLAVAFFSGLFPGFSSYVSPETSGPLHPREALSVKQGVSPDGSLIITRTNAAPAIPPAKKVMNHERTLRAFVVADASGVSLLYVESVKPHEYYAVTGNFVVASEQDAALTWSSASVAVFHGTSPGGIPMRYMVDLGRLTLSAVPLDGVSPQLPNERPSAVLP